MIRPSRTVTHFVSFCSSALALPRSGSLVLHISPSSSPSLKFRCSSLPLEHFGPQLRARVDHTVDEHILTNKLLRTFGLWPLPQKATWVRWQTVTRDCRKPTRTSHGLGACKELRHLGCRFLVTAHSPRRLITSVPRASQARWPGCSLCGTAPRSCPWRAWQSVLPTLMNATDSPDADTLFASTPQLRSQPSQLQTTLLRQVNCPAFLLKPLGPAIRTKTTEKTLVKSIQLQLHKQLVDSHATAPISKATLISQTSPPRSRRPLFPCVHGWSHIPPSPTP